MRQTQAPAATDILDLIKLQSGVIDESRELLCEAVNSKAPDVEKRLRAAIAILRGEAYIAKLNGIGLLRQEGRVHGKEAYEKLGIKVASEPKIPKDILKQCLEAPVKSMIILDIGCPLLDLERASKGGWEMRLGVRMMNEGYLRYHSDIDNDLEKFDSPRWVVVPMEIKRGKIIAEPNIRLQATGILLHQRETGEKLFPGHYRFASKRAGTFAFGVHNDYFRVINVHYSYVDGSGPIRFEAIEPGIARYWKKSEAYLHAEVIKRGGGENFQF